MDDNFGIISLGTDSESWPTRLSRTRISSVQGLSLRQSPDTIATLEDVLRTVQQLGLKRYTYDSFESQGRVGEGESFSVDRCLHSGKVVAVKHIKLGSLEADSHALNRRLRTVLNEIRIMHHTPLRDHPNILSVLGYGWRTIGQDSLPYLVVEYGLYGNLRKYLTETPRSLGTKIILAGDVAAGVSALHQCEIIHGDLKLENIVVMHSWDRPPGVIAKICDFGHSIILANEKKHVKYYGTSMYNAPEIEDQDKYPLPPENLVKCDLWAFALAMWEILNDGKTFFKKNWREDPSYAQPWPISLVSADEQESFGEETRTDERERIFGSFDFKHLSALGKDFISSLNFGSAFADKACLRLFMSQALQVDPLSRPSNIRLGPVMTRFNPSDINALQAKLAIHTGTSEWSFDLLKPDQDKEIIWDHQIQILQDFEKIATPSKPTAASCAAAFQVAMCYMLGFGTCKSFSRAEKFLRVAEDLENVVANLFGPQLRGVITSEASASSYPSYTSQVIQGLELKPPNQAMTLNFQHVESENGSVSNLDQEATSEEKYLHPIQPTKESDAQVTFQSYEELKEWLYSTHVDQSSYGQLETAVLVLPSSKMSLLECAILYRDIHTVNFLVENCPKILNYYHLQEPLLVTACRTTNSHLVESLLRSGLDPSEYGHNSDTLFHWLFMLGDNQSSILPALQNSTGEKCDALDIPYSATRNISPQWPLRLTGTPLAFAVTVGSVSGVELLLKLGANPMTSIHGPSESTDRSTHWTPIHLALKFHSLEILSLLLAAVEARQYGNLWTSAKSRLAAIQKVPAPRITSIFKHLISLDHSADVWKSDIGCMLSLSTPVERIAMHGKHRNSQLAKLIDLLPLSCLAAPSKNGSVALMQAIDFHDVSVVQALLAAYPQLGSTPFRDPLQPENFVYPIHFASQMASHRDAEDALGIVKLLFEMDPNCAILRDSQGRTPLHFAITGSSDRVTKWLIENGADIDATTNRDNHTGQTPLHVIRMASTMEILISAGADINQQDSLGYTLGHIATLSGQEQLVKAVIDGGGKMDITDNLGQTLLHCAVLKRSISILTMLLDIGLDVNATTVEGITPLHLAVQSLRSDILRLLIEYGADISARTRSLSTPLDLCVLAGDDVCLKPLLDTIKFKEPSLVNQRDIGGRTPLHTAASFGRSGMVLDLLSYGADPAAVDYDGNTPLHLLAIASAEVIRRSQGDKVEFCALLCEHLSTKKPAPELLIKNKAGSTPWDLAYEKNDLVLIEVIFQYGGFEACSQFMHEGEYVGSTLLTKAIQGELWDLVILLIKHEETLTRHPKLVYGVATYLRTAARLCDRATLKSLSQSLLTGSRERMNDPHEHAYNSIPNHIPPNPNSRTVEHELCILGRASNLRYSDGAALATSIKEGNDVETKRLIKKLPANVAVKLEYLRCFGKVKSGSSVLPTPPLKIFSDRVLGEEVAGVGTL